MLFYSTWKIDLNGRKRRKIMQLAYGKNISITFWSFEISFLLSSQTGVPCFNIIIIMKASFQFKCTLEWPLVHVHDAWDSRRITQHLYNRWIDPWISKVTAFPLKVLLHKVFQGQINGLHKSVAFCVLKFLSGIVESSVSLIGCIPCRIKQ